MSAPPFTAGFKYEAVVKPPNEAIQSLKNRQGLAFSSERSLGNLTKPVLKHNNSSKAYLYYFGA